VIGGVAQSAGQPIDVTPAQLASATFQSGSGTDQLMVRASDGVLWSNWTAFSVNAPIDHAPVVTGNDTTLAQNTTINVSSLFNVTDADGDAIQTYELVQSAKPPGSDYGNLEVSNNIPPIVSLGQDVFVDASSFAHDVFYLSPFSPFISPSTPNIDQISVRAFDGALWSDWHTVNLTTT
jgi:hypothetical protein